MIVTTVRYVCGRLFPEFSRRHFPHFNWKEAASSDAIWLVGAIAFLLFMD